MQIYIGSDHAGYALKESLKQYLGDLGHMVEDMGAYALNHADDYPDFITPVAVAISQTTGTMGIILGGSGEGEAMCANKVEGVRAAVFYGGSMDIVRLAREHNDANIISLGARFVQEGEAHEAVKLFISTAFTGEERHVRRIGKF